MSTAEKISMTSLLLLGMFGLAALLIPHDWAIRKYTDLVIDHFCAFVLLMAVAIPIGGLFLGGITTLAVVWFGEEP